MASDRGVFKSTMGLSGATFLSRVLGLIREILTAQFIGGGMLMSAWALAFTLPNLFRRILGEGALGTALIPMISHTLEKEGQDSARRKFSTIVIWLTFLLALITVLVALPALLIEPYVTTERWKMALLATPVVMPYCIMICLIGIATSLLNSLKQFFLPAMASLLLNVFLIGALLFFCSGGRKEPVNCLYVLSVAVLLSGLAEMVVLGWLLKKEGMLPELSGRTLWNAPAIREIWHLALPGLIGMSALQVSVICDRTIAMAIGNHAVAALYYSDRLIYLPIGIFAVAFGTVSLSLMSRLAAAGRLKTMLIMMFGSMRQLLFLTVPLAAYMICFGRELLDLLFRRGAFDTVALNESALALYWYAFGIPAFAATKVTVSGFYSRKDMKTPVLVSIFCIVLNVMISISLMDVMRQGGIALATSITAYLNNFILLYLLRKRLGRMPLKSVGYLFVQLLVISAVAALPARYLCTELEGIGFFAALPKNILSLICASALFGAIFTALAFLLRIREARIVTGKLLRRFSKS